MTLQPAYQTRRPGPGHDSVGRRGCQSIRAPERSTTSFHLAESFAIVCANSSGVPPAGSSPIAAKRSRNSGDWIARLIAALSLSTIGRGMRAGPITPLQVGAALVRDVHDLGAGHELEQLAADMAGRAIAGRCVRQLAGMLLRIVDQLR